MTLFLLNILLAVLWCFLWGAFDFYTLLTGLALGYLLLGVYSRVTSIEGYGNKVGDLFRFLAYFLKILTVANFQIAYEIITPRFHMRPRIVRFDVSGLTPVQRTVLGNLITLTPGTLIVDVSRDRRSLYVHCVYGQDREAVLRDLEHLKRRMLTEVF